MKKIKTNIDGFDKVLRGGFQLPPRYNNNENDVNGLVVLIKGEAGTGKSTFALQIARGLYLSNIKGTNVTHYSLEQNSIDLEIKFIKMWYNYLIKEFRYNTFDEDIPRFKDDEEKRRILITFKILLVKFYKKLIFKNCNTFKEAVSNAREFLSIPDLLNWLSDVMAMVKEELDKSMQDDEDRLSSLNTVINIVEVEFEKGQEEINQRYNEDTFVFNELMLELIEKIYYKIFLIDLYSKITNMTFENLERDISIEQSPLVNALLMINDLLNTDENDENVPVVNDVDKEYVEDRVVILDGLNIMTNEERRYVNLHNLVKLLRKKAAVSIIVYEPGISDDNCIEYLVDTTIELRGVYTTEGTNYQLHDLRIPKSRYQNAVLGWQQYKIREYGLDIYPSIHFQVHTQNVLVNEYDKSLMSLSKHLELDKPNGNEKNSKHNSGSIIEDLLDGLMPGSTTVVMGTRGTFKSTLTLDFLYAGAKEKKNSLLVSLIDNEDTTKDAMNCCRENERLLEECGECKKNIFLFHQRPGCITSAELLNAIVNRIEHSEYLAKENNNEKLKINRIAFWDLTQLEHRFPFIADDKMFIPALMDLCRDKKITLVIMGSENNKFSKGVAAMADNIVFVWRDQVIGKGNKGNLDSLRNDLNEKLGVGNNEENNFEYLSLLVERSEGLIGSEGKKLKLLGIGASTNGGFDIVDDRSDCNAIMKEYKKAKTGEEESNVMKKIFKTYYKVEKKYWKCLENAPEKIKTITNIQGMKSSID